MAILHIRKDGREHTRLEFKSARLTVGREGCDVNLTHPHISATQCAFERCDGGFTVTDLSRNGTYLNGTRLEGGLPHRIGPADCVHFTAFELRLTTRRPARRKPEVTREISTQDETLVGVSPAMRQIRDLVERLAVARCSVLVTGEPGVGKGEVTRLLQALGPGGPFVTRNGAVLRGELAASELFGHEKGAFTGAESRSDGAFHQAHGGTLFLDEIAELPLHVQRMLLCVLEEGRFRRVGGLEDERVHVRVVAATNQDLWAMAEATTFRQDLLDRLNGFRVHVPPLRERPEDIPVLVETILARYHPEHRITDDAVEFLSWEPWAANVRGLRNVLDRSVVLSASDTLEVEHVQAALAVDTHPTTPPSPKQRPWGTPPGDRATIKRMVKKHGQRKTSARLDISRGSLRHWLDKWDLASSDEE